MERLCSKFNTESLLERKPSDMCLHMAAMQHRIRLNTPLDGESCFRAEKSCVTFAARSIVLNRRNKRKERRMGSSLYERLLFPTAPKRLGGLAWLNGVGFGNQRRLSGFLEFGIQQHLLSGFRDWHPTSSLATSPFRV